MRTGVEAMNHQVDIVDVCHRKIAGCLACEYCHTKEKGISIQKDDMQKIYEMMLFPIFKDSELSFRDGILLMAEDIRHSFLAMR